MNIKNQTPLIRFNDFNENWEKCKLGSVAQITMGQSPDGSTYSNKPTKYILVQGNADLEDGWVKPRVWTTQLTKKADMGDLIMSVRAPAGSMGKTAYDVVLGRGVAGIKGSDFLYQLLVNLDINGYWKQFTCGSTFESLNSDNIKNAEIFISNLQAERCKIGSFFSNLDNLISLQQHKYYKLVNIKKSLLEDFFHLNHNKVPKIRFKGFTNPWKQYKLGDALEEYLEFCEKNGRYEHVSLTKEGILPKSARYNRDSLVQHEDKKYRITHFNDICYNPANLKFGVICRNNYKDCIFSPIYVTLKVNDNFEPKFIENYVKMERFILKSLRNQEGTVYERMAVKPNDLLAMDIFAPDKTEQKVIGECLNSIDTLITLQQHKLVKLKNIKKALLNKMLV